MLLFLLACFRSEPSAPVAPAPVVDPYEAAAAFNGTRPLYEQPLGDGRKPVPGLPDLSAKTCGGCHQALYEEWHSSVHAVAWVDPQFQGEITKSGNRWLCLNCHTPLQVQQDVLAVGLQDGDVERPVLVANPNYDPALREEGITCAACHVRDGVIHGPGLGGVAPHPVKAEPEVYRTGALCLRCHQAVATYPGKDFTCTFNTGEEWKAGPYDDEGTTCVTCHMPKVERPAAEGGRVVEVGRHWWRGSGIPKIAGRYPPPEANPFGLVMTASLEGKVLVVNATNAHAGHMLPTGDPERKVKIEVVFTRAGTTVGEQTLVYGQEWTWSPPTKHGDTRLHPRETRESRLDVPEGADEVVLTALNERMSEENRAYHDLDGYPIQAMVQTIRLPISPGSR